MTDVLFILVGIVGVLWGADKFTDGACDVARRLRIPQMVIGLTVVSLGTSLPELCVSLAAALRGTPDMAVGNVVGSNQFNALLIVGCAALVAPITILKETVVKDIPFALFAAGLLTALCSDRFISRTDALLLLAMLVVFMAYTLRAALRGKSPEEPAAPSAPIPPMWQNLLWVVVGIACLVAGSRLFVAGATAVAYKFHVSEAVVGLTIVAGGTSLPELATSVVAARKGQSGIAIGNVVGSNVLNILLIIGLTGIICPMHCAGITGVDYTVLLGSMVLLWGFSFTKYRLERWEGGLLVAVYVLYLGWLVARAVGGVG